MRVDEVCSQDPVHIPMSSTLQEAAIRMRDRHVGSLIVTESTAGGTRAVGMVTDRDIVLASTANGGNPCQTPVGDVMTRGMVAIQRQASIQDAMQMMLSHGVRRLGVLDGESLTGVLSVDDILGALALDWGMLSTLVYNEQEHERSGKQSPASLPDSL